LNSKNIRVLILSAGKIEKDLEKIIGDIPSGLIPLNGRPVIFRIIDKLLDEGFTKLSITVGYKKEIIQKIITEQYKTIKFEFIPSEFEKPPGNSLKTSIRYCSEEKLLVILGDTLIENNLTNLIDKNNSFVLSSQKFTNPKNWCVITQKNQKIDKIFDKDSNLHKNKNQYVLIGYYFFNDVKLLKSILENFNDEDRIEISYVLDKYKHKKDILVEFSEQWNDVGHLENYFLTKQFLLKARHFNSLYFSEDERIITKKSENKIKLIDEINWYKNIPKEFFKLLPTLVDSDVSDDPFLKLEYVQYPTLSEIWLYDNFSTIFWLKIIDDLFKIIHKFNNFKKDVSIGDYNFMYFDKTVQRINELTTSNILFKKIFDEPTILINNKKFQNWSILKDKIKSKINNLHNVKDNCIIHGDLYFSNILYDLKNNDFKLIDPRGKWGKGNSGDIKYDIAKVRHSIVGGFDTIANGLYSVSYDKKNGIIFESYKPKNHELISKKLDSVIEKSWNIDDIKMIEGLLFISMIPLHKDNFERQLAFYSIGIQRLNEIF
jgi:dTDP-glucose pyrophosphorylase